MADRHAISRIVAIRPRSAARIAASSAATETGGAGGGPTAGAAQPSSTATQAIAAARTRFRPILARTIAALRRTRTRQINPAVEGRATETLQDLSDPLALARVGEAPEPGLGVVGHVVGLVGGGDHAGHRRLGDQVFEEKLGPARAVEFGGPAGHRLAANAAEQIAALEGLVDDDGHLALAAGR